MPGGPSTMTQAYRNLPSVERLLQTPEVQALTETLPREVVADLVRQQVDDAREAIRNGDDAPTRESLAAAVVTSAESFNRLRPQGVINATGVIIHTNLGRAPPERRRPRWRSVASQRATPTSSTTSPPATAVRAASTPRRS